MMSPAEVKAKDDKEKATAKVKGLKQQIKKEVKKTGSRKADAPKFDLLAELDKALTDSPESVDKFQKLLDKFKKVEEKAPVAETTRSPRGGENYRNN
jgi:hypothetical protein